MMADKDLLQIDPSAVEGPEYRVGRRGLVLAVLLGTGALAACGRKPGTLLPPSGAEGDEDDFPATFPRY